MTYIAIDIETTGLNPRKDTIIGIAFHIEDKSTWVEYNKETIPAINRILEKPNPKVFHNATFDLSFLTRTHTVKGKIHDTLLLAHMLDPDRDSYKLKVLSRLYLGLDSTKEAKNMDTWLAENKLTRSSITLAPPKLLEAYACEDVRNTYNLFKFFCQKVSICREWFTKQGFTKDLWNCYLDEDSALIPVIMGMQERGIKLDIVQLVTKQQEMQEKAAQLLQKLPRDKAILQVEELLYQKAIANKLKKNKSGKLKKELPRIPFNWDSNDHLKTLFYNVYGENITKMTHKGNPSIDADILQQFQSKHPWISDLLEYKTLMKLASTYVQNLLGLQEGGVIHAHFHLNGTATGRLSASAPNLQNIPKHGGIKELFIARPGHKFMYADYSQLELRVAAHLSQDPLLLAAYRDGLDLHRITASILFNKAEKDIIDEERAIGKTINFAIIYNASGFRIAQIMGYLDGVDLENKAQVLQQVKKGDELKKKLFGKYSGLKKFVDNKMSYLVKYKVAVTEFGRIRRLPKIDSEIRQESNHAIKAGFNMYIQSFGASICKRAMIDLHNNGHKIVNQIHDAIIIEEKEELIIDKSKEMLYIMENIVNLDIPLKADFKVLTSFQE